MNFESFKAKFNDSRTINAFLINFLNDSYDLDDINEKIFEILKSDKNFVQHFDNTFGKNKQEMLLEKVEKVEDSEKSEKDIIEVKTPSDVQAPVMNELQQEAFNNALKGYNVFITGPAGVGKSFCVKLIKDMILSKTKKIGITSSTGCSALSIDGQTVHSFLGIGLGKLPADRLYADLIKSSKKYSLYLKLKKLKVLIIDEISMINGDLFELIDKYLKLIKNNDSPFGGVQLILSGDFFQLSPVNSNYYCFESPIWDQSGIKTIELKKSFRQSDQTFVDILNSLRYGNCTNEILEILNQEVVFPRGIRPVKLYTINKDVDTENKKIMKSLDNEIFSFKASSFTREKCDDKSIDLCKDAQVMITYNIDPKNEIINGKIGIIDNIDYYKKSITLRLFDKENKPYFYQINYIVKEKEEFDEVANKIVKTKLYSYIPLKLAYCITIHKCVSENTIIYTHNGMKRIKNVLDLEGCNGNTVHNCNDVFVETINGISAVSNVFKGNKEVCFEITTMNGYSIVISLEHKILHKLGDNLTWNTGDELNKIFKKTFVNMILISNIGCQSLNYYNTFDFYEILDKNEKGTYPFIINEDISYFIGRFMACNVKISEDNKGNKKFNLDYLTLLNDKIKEILYKYFDIKKPYKLDSIYSFINYYKLLSQSFVPDCILSNKLSCQTEFINGFLEIGKIHNYYSYGNCKKNILKDIQILMLNLGFTSTRSKTMLFKVEKCNNKYITDRVLSMELKNIKVYDLTVPSHENYISNGFISHNSQSMSIEYLDIDFKSKCFSPGHGYVAVSRSVDIKKMKVRNASKKDFFANEKVKEFYENV